MQTGTIGKFITILTDAVFKIKLITQFESVTNLLHGVQVLGKKLPLMSLLVSLFITGLVIGWGLFIAIGIFILHSFSFSWLSALSIMFVINLLALSLIALFLSMNVKKMRRKKISENGEKSHARVTQK